ncbi:hypothetical protein [Shewanella sp. TC10]|uniref:hypothetical protein n=1 Tax=Shewanella sp. TC10 TaxID=1419739 RepID=UPI00129D7C41|nr:hypothetical protein [Shewanella sp. TC10]
MKESIMKLQLAMFYQQPQFRPDTSMNQVNMDMGNLFDAMPQILSMPNDVPHDIPRVQMRSENNKYNCNIAPARIDFILNGNNLGEEAWPEIVQDFKAKAALFIKSITSRSKVNRFGVIGNFYIPDKTPSNTISRKHLKTDLQNAQEINLRFNKASSMHGLNLNNISSINTALSGDGSNPETGIFIELDVNNVPTMESVSTDTLTEVVAKILPTFSPDQVKGLVK